MQVYKILIATLKNTPSHSIHNGWQNQKPPERRWCPPKQTYNWIAAKRRINRHDLYGASAAERLTAQRRAGLPVRKVRFGSADKQHTVWCHTFKLSQAAHNAPSERQNECRRVIILPTAFSDLLSVTGKEVKCSLKLRQDNFGRSAVWSGVSAATVWAATVCCSTTEKRTLACSWFPSITSSATISRTLCFLSTRNCIGC